MVAEPGAVGAPDDPVEPTPAAMRQALGHFASGVTVVTGMSAGGPVGFACQSFASVSLEPPLVLFCADHRGRSWPAIRAAGRFTVHILSEDQAELCQRFGSTTGRKFEDLAWSVTRWGTPALPGVITRVHCEVTDVHACGDHDVVIGGVLALENTSGTPPLLFFRGAFGLAWEGQDGWHRSGLDPVTWAWDDHWW
jgi:3-hydroxy-9,10-secoandrosta-1,3,5(10)-triene-9,17-dione monooxygenase reductase component